MALIETVIAEVQGSSVLLFLTLVALFIVAYRVLQAVINTAIVTVLSGVFFVVLDFIGLGPAITVNRIMFFMVLGTALFILYSSIATVITTSSTLLGALQRIWGWARTPFDRGGDDGEKEKEIVLEELQDD